MYQWSYLWASADIDLSDWHYDHLGPTTYTWLAHDAAENLTRRQRFTVHFGRRRPKSDPGSFHRRARDIADSLASSIRQRHPALHFDERFRIIGRASVALQLIPHQEWHPEFHRTSAPPRIVSCDASWSDSRHVRAGISIDKKSFSINLAPAEPRISSQAEFLGVCLAMLTNTAERTPLLVRCDSINAVTEAQYLGKGIMPSWMYRESGDVAQRLAIAAMTSMRLRPVIVKHVPRTRTTKAHEAATYHAPETGVFHIRTWAKKQGIPLSWYDVDRGLVRP